jgi:hypothetical protein
MKLAWKNGSFMTWNKLVSCLQTCDPGSSVCQPCGGLSFSGENNMSDFQNNFQPRVSIVIGLGNTGADDTQKKYSIALVDLKMNNAAIVPPATGTISGKCIAGDNRGKWISGITADGYLKIDGAEAKDIPVVVGGVQRSQGSGGLFNQFVEINGEAVFAASDFCKLPAWPAAKTSEDREKDKLLVPIGPGCCLPIEGITTGTVDIPVMREPVPPGSALDTMMYDDCRAPIMKTGLGTTLPSRVKRTLKWEKHPEKPSVSKTAFLKRNAQFTPKSKQMFKGFDVTIEKIATCGQSLMEQLMINTIGDGTTFGYYGTTLEDE